MNGVFLRSVYVVSAGLGTELTTHPRRFTISLCVQKSINVYIIQRISSLGHDFEVWVAWVM